eukprot:8605126-Prorocentrum_lima.AAC.1
MKEALPHVFGGSSVDDTNEICRPLGPRVDDQGCAPVATNPACHEPAGSEPLLVNDTAREIADLKA